MQSFGKHIVRNSDLFRYKPRVPAGQPDGGQWTTEGGVDEGDNSDTNAADDRSLSPPRSYEVAANDTVLSDAATLPNQSGRNRL
jgi:hypothetical protein